MFLKFWGVTISALLLSLVACSDDNSTDAFVEPPESSGTSVGTSESCSSVETLSSSQDIGKSSSSVAVAYKGDLWDGLHGVSKVNTGSEKSGYWFAWNFEEPGTPSKIVFPTATPDDYSAEALDAVVDSCKGLCGTFVPGNSSIPTAGIGFTVAEEGKSADISSWGGFCLTYSSELRGYIYLISDYRDETAEFSIPRVDLYSTTRIDAPVLDYFVDSSTTITRCIKWHDFRGTDWVNHSSDTLFGDVAATKARSIRFWFVGDYKEADKFNIKAIGTYDENLPQLYWPKFEWYGGIEITVEDSVTCVWKGVHPYYEENGTGSWFLYDNGSSGIEYPVELSGDEYGYWWADPIIEYCGGFCGTVRLRRTNDDEAFAGIGYSIAGYGEERVCENNFCRSIPIAANIESWGGICITYYSQKDAYLKVAIDGAENEDFPSIHLPQSSTLSERCFAWNEFDKMSSEKIKKATTIQFEFHSDAAFETAGFNLAAIGKYYTQGACNLNFTSVPYIPNSSASVIPWNPNSSASNGASSSSQQIFKDSCSFSELDDLWYGPTGSDTVITGFIDRTKYGGLWYAFADANDEHNAHTEFPEGTYVDDQRLWTIIEYCQGVCATVEGSGYAGVGFDIVGMNIDASLESANITDWGGLCVTYSLENGSLYVEFKDVDYLDFSNLGKDYAFVLPSTDGYVTTECKSWEILNNESLSSGRSLPDFTKISSVLFYAYSKENYSSTFNILGLGKYHDITDMPQFKCREPQLYH